ncbi:MAG: serine/threonine-protein kinase HAL4/sat4 [Chaenotheca gracillima]|nr:MAG: serine/threonine-protein kinase HAL4/sat4 [Chaenotheca gracillima]
MPKNFAKAAPKKKGKKSEPAPETADEFLAAGVDFEEAGEKWRAGDAAKSTRFFGRAIDNYDEALRKFPDSFDIAYNKARVQYELTQYPKLVAQTSAPLPELLHVALRSHREALRIRPEHADALFNTAQVLTSLAETMIEARSPEQQGRREAVSLLEEAVGLFQRCLQVQEQEYAASREPPQAETPPNEEEMAVDAKRADGGSDSEQWATVLEQVTQDTLLDAVLAQLETLRTMCSLISTDQSSSGILTWVEKYTAETLDDRLRTYTPSTDSDPDPTRLREIYLTKANFSSALAEAQFRHARIDIPTYQHALEQAFGAPLDIHEDPAGLCDRADALTAFSSALGDATSPSSGGPELSPSDQARLDLTRWKALSTALDSLTTASKLPNASNVARIHLARGDTEMLRLQIGNPPGAFDTAAKSRETLLKNAQVFYRGAVGFANVAAAGGAASSGGGGVVGEELEGRIKEAVAARLAGNEAVLQRVLESIPEELVRRVITDAQAEGVVPAGFDA